MQDYSYRNPILIYISACMFLLTLLAWIGIDKPYSTAHKNLQFINLQQEEINKFEKRTDSLLHEVATLLDRNAKKNVNNIPNLLSEEDIDIFTPDKLLFGNLERYYQLIGISYSESKSKIFQTDDGQILTRKQTVLLNGSLTTLAKSVHFPFGNIPVQVSAQEGSAFYNSENELLGYIAPLPSPFSFLYTINPISYYLLWASFILATIWTISVCFYSYRANQIVKLYTYTSVWCIAFKAFELALSYNFTDNASFVTTPFLPGSSYLNPSYLSKITSIIALLIWLGVIASKLHRTTFYKQISKLSTVNKQIFTISILFISYVWTQFIFEEISSFYFTFRLSSQFSNLFKENTYYLLLLVSLHLISIVYFLLLHSFFILFNVMNKKRNEAYLAIGIGTLGWFLIIYFSQIQNIASLSLVIVWILQYTFHLPQGFYSVRHKTSFYAITIVYIFAVFTTVVSYYFEKEQRDIYQNEIRESFLYSSSSDFTNELFSIQKTLVTDTDEILKVQDDSVRNQYIRVKYNELLPINASFQTYLIDDWESNSMCRDFKRTSLNGIYRNILTKQQALLIPKQNKWLLLIFQEPRLQKEYYRIQSKKNIAQSILFNELKAGTALIQLPDFSLSDMSGEEIELTRDFVDMSNNNTTDISSFVVDKKLIYQYRLTENTLFLVYFPAYTWIDFWSNLTFASLVSFLFLFFYFAIGLVTGKTKFGKITSLTTKIVVYIQASFLIPSLIITFFIIRFFNTEIKKTQLNSYLQQTKLIQKQIVPAFQDFHTEDISDSTLQSVISSIDLQPLQSLAIRDTRGKTIYSSLTEKGLENLSIESSYWHSLKDSLLVFNGTLNNSIVVTGIRQPIFASNKLKKGYLDMYFFDSSIEHTKQISEILKSVLTVFIFIFNGLFLVSFFLSKRLINPIKVVAQRLRNTTLLELSPKEHIPLVKHDEIGLLVDAYNGMIQKLEESKNVIAEAEKQTAWQEIAKQVAHEIKNPLTPMKLSIQRLQRTLSQSNEPKNREIQQSLSLLIEQIDDISTIASSFSSYAQMPIPKKIRMNLTGVVQKSIHFMLTSQQVHISFSTSDEAIWVLQDPSFMDRLLKNIFLNAIQAVPKKELPIIEVKIEKRIRTAVISVKDNGQGIPENVKEKIFLPHFSTKKIGSGIGLAIAKKGIESMGGNIWFESKEGVGTTFYIEVPMQETVI